MRQVSLQSHTILFKGQNWWTREEKGRKKQGSTTSESSRIVWHFLIYFQCAAGWNCRHGGCYYILKLLALYILFFIQYLYWQYPPSVNEKHCCLTKVPPHFSYCNSLNSTNENYLRNLYPNFPLPSQRPKVVYKFHKKTKMKLTINATINKTNNKHSRRLSLKEVCRPQLFGPKLLRATDIITEESQSSEWQWKGVKRIRIILIY